MILSLFYKHRKGILAKFRLFIKPQHKTLRSSLAFFLLFGTLFTPLRAEAGLFSSLLGDQAFAGTTPSIYNASLPDASNSQNIGLLEANVTSASVIESKGAQKAPVADTTSAGIIVSDNALVPSTGAMSGTGGPEASEDVSIEDISVYVIRKGDTIGQIADMFDVSVNTILWTNDMKKGDPLKEGEVLLILPTSGVKHVVAKGETLAGIAKKYKVDVPSIMDFNDIETGESLTVGQELFIPDAEIPATTTSSSGSTTKSGTKVSNGSSKVISGYFINPVPELKRKSQGLHGKNGVDLAAPTGTRVLASAPGKVIFAKLGWNGAYGNLVILQHSNGTKTVYAHLSKINVSAGQQVDRGQVIGLVGSTGRSTGPHLHFEVHGAKNPGADWSWAKQ